MRATRRTLLSIGLVSVLVASLVASFGTAGAQVPADAATAKVDVREILAGTASKEFKITVTNALGLPINALIVGTPPGGYVLSEGRAPGWQSLIISSREVLFTGGAIGVGSSAVFSMFTNVPRPAQDITGRWAVQVSSDGGTTSANASPEGTGTLDTTIRVLQVTTLGITAPAGAVDNSVTGLQDNVDAVCQVENAGSGLLSVSASLASRDGRFTASTPPAADIPAGGTATYPFDLAFSDVTSTQSDRATCRASSGSKATALTKFIDLSIQPRAIFEYVQDSLQPRLVSPGANPSFSLKVLKRANGASSTDGSPAVALDQAATNFAFSTFGPTGLASGTTIPAGRVPNAILQFAAAQVPPCPGPNCISDGDYGVTINVVGTDANGAAVSFKPLQNVLDQVRIDAQIPVVDVDLSGAGSRCCNAPPAVRNGDTLTFGGSVTDRNPTTGQHEPCGSCTVQKAELVLGSTELGGTEIGRIDVTTRVTNTNGVLGGNFTGAYGAARSVLLEVTMKDAATNLSAPTPSNLVAVDNIAPVITRAIATAAPSVANQDLQRQLRVEFSEMVDNFDRPADGVCPGIDWRTDNNNVLNCSRDIDFLSAGLTVANQLPDDGPDLGTLGYFPTATGVITFHDRVGHPIATGSRVDIIDRIPPKAPILNTVGGQGRDADDGKFYTKSSNAAFVLGNPSGGNPVLPATPAVKAGYTVELYRENNDVDGFQPEASSDGTPADTKMGSAVAQGPTVTITPTGGLPTDGSQSGLESTVYARSLDTASPANPTPINLVQAFPVVVDSVAPAIASADAQVDRIVVTLNEFVRGRNAAFDWQVQDRDGNLLNRRAVEGSGNQRSVVMNDSRYFRETVALITYRFVGTPNDRYKDRAGWFAADNTITFLAA